MSEHDDLFDFDIGESASSSAQSKPAPSVTGKTATTTVSGWKFVLGSVMGVAIFAGVLVAMGTRLEHQDLTPPDASTQEKARQTLAEQAVRIENSALQLQADKPDNAVLQSIADATSTYADGLGGVWIPWPNGAPTGYTNPPVETEPATDLDSATLVEELMTFSDTARQGLEGTPSEQQRDLDAMALGAQFLAMNLSEAEKLTPTPTCGDVDLAAAGSAANTTSVLEAADAARQWLETDAANMAAGSRVAELERIDALSKFEEYILRSGTADTRTAFAAYPELEEGETYTSSALALLTARLLESAVQSDAAGRDAIFSFTCSLYLDSGERNAALPLPGL